MWRPTFRNKSSMNCLFQYLFLFGSSKVNSSAAMARLWLSFKTFSTPKPALVQWARHLLGYIQECLNFLKAEGRNAHKPAYVCLKIAAHDRWAGHEETLWNLLSWKFGWLPFECLLQKLAWIDSAKLLFTLQHISKRIPENVLGDNSGKLVSKNIHIF